MPLTPFSQELISTLPDEQRDLLCNIMSGNAPRDLLNDDFDKLCVRLGFKHFRDGVNFWVQNTDGVTLTKYHPKGGGHRSVVDPGAITNFAIALAGMGYITPELATANGYEKFDNYLGQAKSRTGLLAGLIAEGAAESQEQKIETGARRISLDVLQSSYRHHPDCPTIPLGFRLNEFDLSMLATHDSRKEAESDYSLLLACLIMMPPFERESHFAYWQAAYGLITDIANSMAMQKPRVFGVRDLAILDRILGFSNGETKLGPIFPDPMQAKSQF